jgi:hypothetical protein
MKDMTKAMDQKVRERDEMLVDILAKIYNFDAEDAKKQLWPSKADKAEATKKRVILSKETDLSPKEQKMYTEMKELAAAKMSPVEETPATEVVAVVTATPVVKKASAPAAVKLILPFPGYKMEGKCCSIRPNHDLYTQCTAQVSEGTQFCGSCTKDIVAETGKPKYGTVEDRLACDAMDYHPAGCPKVKHYSRLMKEKKYQYTREQVCEEVARLGLVALDEWHFEEQSPAAKKKAEKAVTVSDEVSGEIANIKAKKVKAPTEAKKSKKAAKAETSEVPDLFKNLTVVDTSAQVVASAAAEESSGEELEEDDYEEDA